MINMFQRFLNLLGPGCMYWNYWLGVEFLQGYLAHLSQFITKSPGNTFLHTSREVNASPPANSHPIDHFLFDHIPLPYMRQTILLLSSFVVF
nr:hypothetical protein Iba_chr15aCG9690 [Ipomoea batatas]